MIVSIIIPTFNRLRTLKNLLSDIQEQTIDDTIQLIPVVVIDGSSDETIAFCAHHNVKHIIGTGDWWYTQSVNNGVDYALSKIKPNYLLLTNDDVRLESNFMYMLISKSSSIGEEDMILTTVFKDSRNGRVINRGARKFNSKLLVSTRRKKFDRSDIEVCKGVYRSYRFSGMCAFLTPRTWTAIGGYDNTFKQYGSDTEFGIRAMIKGCKIFIDSENSIYQSVDETHPDDLSKNISLYRYWRSLWDPYSSNYLMNPVRIAIKHSRGIFLLINVIRAVGNVFLRFISSKYVIFKNKRHFL